MRLIASAIIVLSGALCIGLAGSAAEGHSQITREAYDVGFFVLFVGGIVFAVEFFRDLFDTDEPRLEPDELHSEPDEPRSESDEPDRDWNFI